MKQKSQKKILYSLKTEILQHFKKIKKMKKIKIKTNKNIYFLKTKILEQFTKNF